MCFKIKLKSKAVSICWKVDIYTGEMFRQKDIIFLSINAYVAVNVLEGWEVKSYFRAISWRRLDLWGLRIVRSLSNQVRARTRALWTVEMSWEWECSQPDTDESVSQVQINHCGREGGLFPPMGLEYGNAVMISMSPLLTVVNWVIRSCSLPVCWDSGSGLVKPD